MTTTKYPKFLVECDFEASEFSPAIPTRTLWVARTRAPFCLARIDASVTIYEGANPSALVELWPAILDVKNRSKLIDGLVRALFREHDLDPSEWDEPEWCGPAPEPPDFIHMLRPESDTEFVLEPHAPRLWKIRLQMYEHEEGSTATWVRGFGLEPEFPKDTRRVAEFVRTLT
jgi:hypothetical protein